MNDQWQSKFFCPLDLGLESDFLFPDKSFIPVEIDAGFSDGQNIRPVKLLFNESQFFTVVFPNRGGMKAHHWKTDSWIFLGHVEHCFAGRAVDVRQEHPGDPGIQRSLYHCIPVVRESVQVKMGM